MTREEAIRWLKDIHRRFNPTGENLENEGGDVHLQALDMAIEALKEKNQSDSFVRDDAEDCKEHGSKLDLISRQEAVKQFCGHCKGQNEPCEHRQSCKTMKVLKSLPSAEPKTGEWIEVEVFPEVYDIEGVKAWGSEMQCDQCGFRFTAIEGHITQYNYCPNCGAYMRGEKHE